MDVSLVTQQTDAWRTDALLYFAFEDESHVLLQDNAWAEGDGGWWPRKDELEDFRGKTGEVNVFYSPGASGVSRIVLTGLGKQDKADVQTFREAVARSVKRCRELKLANVGIPLSGLKSLPFESSQLIEEAVISMYLGLYRYNELKSEPEEDSSFPEVVSFLAEDEVDDTGQQAVTVGIAVGQGVCLARDLTNMPSNLATPVYLAETAQRLGKEHQFNVEVFEPGQLETMGMGAFAAVFKGSCEPARLIVLEYAPAGHEQDKPIVLVGKGVTFDSGGISLKPSAKMDEMKTDMAGVGALFGVFKALAGMDLEQRVVAIMPCTENMPDCKATKPGDVITAMSGKTVEIINTDAEGRLILADALHYAEKYEPELIIDIATLTGACVVALGKHVAAVMGNDETLIQDVHRTGCAVGDRIWPMPLWDFLFDELKSDVADMKNVGSRMGGALHAAMFLKQFVPEGIPWAHIDIAGPSRADKANALTLVGGSGFGVRTLVEFLRRKAQR